MPKHVFRPIYTLLDEKAALFHDKVAIEYSQRHLSYSQLREQSNQLARLLLSNGIGKDDIVAIFTDDVLQVIISLIAILKAGAAFVIFDPKLPESRLQILIDVASPKVFISKNEFLGLLDTLALGLSRDFSVYSQTSVSLAYENLVVSSLELEAYATDNLGIQREANSFSYLYFTSGSTGIPKAIMGRLSGIDHFINWETETFGVNDKWRISQLTAPMFDAFLRDIFLPLCNGATLVVPDPMLVYDAPALVEWLDEQRIDLIHTVPSLLRTWLPHIKPEHFHSLKHVLLSGETITPSDVSRWYKNGSNNAELVNLYGPSETTMIKFYYCIRPEDENRQTIPIGQTISGARALILDEYKRACPQGTAGEIYIRTPYASLGYYRQEDLTKSVFIPNPFNDDPKDLIYKTGDIGILTHDGVFELLGRNDTQIKIRGTRIELEEIEETLRRHPAIADVAVKAWNDKDNNAYLCAYVVLSKEEELSEIHLHVAKFLPEVMRPAIFQRLESLPRLASRKINRAELPPPQFRQEKGHYTVLEDAWVGIISSLWAEILGKYPPNIHTNFFSMGGHSLLAAQFLSKINKSLEANISLSSFFNAPTISGILESLMLSRGNVLQIPKASKFLAYPLSYRQKALWNDYLSHNLNSIMIRQLPVYGEINLEAFRRAIQKLQANHEILSCRMKSLDGDILQEYCSPLAEPIQSINLSGNKLEEQKRMIQQVIDNYLQNGFSYFNEPPWCCLIFQLEENYSLIFLVLSHIITDDWSNEILIKELLHNYKDELLLKDGMDVQEALQFRDYVVWQNEWLDGDNAKTQLDYWQKQFIDQPPGLNLSSATAGSESIGASANIKFYVSNETVDALQVLSQTNNVTLFITLLAAFNYTMMKLTGIEDILIGMPVANRYRLETDSLVGYLANTLLLRTKVFNDEAIENLLERTKEKCFEAYAHPDIPYEYLVNHLQAYTLGSFIPPKVKFQLRYNENVALHDSDVQASNKPLELIIRAYTKLDIHFTMLISKNTLSGSVVYNAEIMSEHDVKKIIEAYENTLLLFVKYSKQLVD